MVDAVDDHADAQVLARLVAIPVRAGLDHDRDRVLGLALDPLDPAAQLLRRPQRVDQLEVVVGQQRREERAHGAQRLAPARGDLGTCSYLCHGRGILPVENECQPPFTGHSLSSVSAERATPLRQVRERDLVAATRALFDERGMQDAQIEEIARAAGIARGLVYRHFSSKEELYVLTVTDYLDELAELLEMAVEGDDEPTPAPGALHRGLRALLPALSRLPRQLAGADAAARTRAERDRVRVGLAAARAEHGALPRVRRGRAARRAPTPGDFEVEDPDYMANVLWTQALGVMHLARIRVGVREAAPGVPALFRITADQTVESCVTGALLLVGAQPRAVGP